MTTPRSLVAWAWNSPTVATWLSLASRGFGLLVLMPVVLARFDAAGVTVWLSLTTLIGLQTLADFGFTPTFCRAIAYAMAGASTVEQLSRRGLPTRTSGMPNWDLMQRVLATMRGQYAIMSWLLFLALGIGGTLALRKPIGELKSSHVEGWAAWSIILVTVVYTFRGAFYSAYLQGINEIVILRRAEAIWTCIGLMVTAIILACNGGILAAICACQSFAIVSVLWNRWLARTACEGRLARMGDLPFDREVFHALWPTAWRSGVGMLLYTGSVQSTGLIYAQVPSSEQAASFLLALRLASAAVQFSQAPFNSKIPLLSRIYAQKGTDAALAAALRGIRLSYSVFLVVTIGVAITAPLLLTLLHAKTQFVPLTLWFALSSAYLLERIGAVNIQLYSLSNHIVWHITNGVTGVIYIVLSIALLPTCGPWAFPIAMAVACTLCFTTYSTHLAHRLFHVSTVPHELRTGAIPALLALIILMAISSVHPL